MRIGIVTQWYPPEPNHITGELAARGHEVRVLTTSPNYPDGRVYPGYRQRWNDSNNTGNVTVRRVPVYPSHDGFAMRRAANFLSFAATSSLAAMRYLAGMDAVYVYPPPATAFAAAAVARLIGRTPIVLHVQDVLPESVTASSMTPSGYRGRLLNRTLAATMRRLYRTASAIAVISPSMAELLVERGADPDKPRVVLNWTDERLFRPVPATASARAAIGHRGRCTCDVREQRWSFQRIGTAIRAAVATDGLVDLVIVGSGLEEPAARRLAEELGASNIRFLGWKPPEQMAALYAAAEYQLICLRDLPGLRGTVPSKLQAAFACGAPVIMSTGGDAARIVESAGAGFTCPPEDVAALAERFAAVATLSPQSRADMARRAQRTYRERMSLRTGADQIEDLLLKASAQGTTR